MKRYFAVSEHSTFVSAALLLVRVVAGLAFAFHGWSKIQSPFGWMGPDASTPGAFQALAAISEFGGGMAWILGLLTPLATLGIMSTMTVAFSTMTFKIGAPFVSPDGGASSELAAVYFSIGLALIAAGPGRFSADRLIFGSRSQ
jgi:putative oxidoreductase